MSILELQRRLVEVGRVRMGEKKATSNGGSRPAKLTKWRLTSRDRVRLEAAARVYGGAVQPWDDQHELYTEADALDIAIVPGQALSQFYELWGRPAQKKPVICLRRCDGATELLSDKPCLCMQESGGDPDAQRACAPTTRLLVLLRNVPGIGAWRLDTHGWYAAQELAGTAEMLEMLTASRVPVRARLRLEQRSVQRGEELRRFVVPVLDIDATLDEAMAALGQGAPMPAAPAIDAGARELEERHPDGMVEAHVDAMQTAQARHFKPVPAALEAPPAPSVADQLATAHKQPAPRANAASPIPPTRAPHRAAGDARPHPREGDEQPASESAPAHPVQQRAGEAPDPAAVVVSHQEAIGIARMCADAGVPRAAMLAAFCAEQGEPIVTHAHEFPAALHPVLRQRLLDVFHGRTMLIIDGDENAARLADIGAGDGAPPAAGPNGPIPTEDYWKARLEYVRGVGPAKLLKMARSICERMHIDVPNELGEIPDHRDLRLELNRWLIDARADADAAA